MPGRATPERPLGELVAEAASEMSTLVRQELALAKAELREDAKAAGKGAGAFGAAGVLALFGLLFLSLAAMFALYEAGLSLAAAGGIVGAVYVALAAVAAVVGKNSFGRVSGIPKTAETIKEDVEWAKHPRS